MAQPILITEEYWANSQFSVVRYTGGMQWNGVHYVICNKEGKDIFVLSYEAEKAGRDKFIELIKEHQDLTPEKAFELAGIEVKKSKRKKK